MCSRQVPEPTQLTDSGRLIDPLTGLHQLTQLEHYKNELAVFT
jgi:hypothetical protein